MTLVLARRFVIGIAALLCSSAMAGATGYYLCTDVPTSLGGTDYTPGQILVSSPGVYSLQIDLAADPDLQLGGLERRADGIWLLSPAVPQEGAGPRDVVFFDGVSPSPFFDGNANGVPDLARIDAVLLEGGHLVLSFDVPVSLGGVDYGPSDLVRWDAPGFSLGWGAQAAGVPAGSNLVGASIDPGGHLVMTFDTPTTLDGVEYLPGQLVQWNGGTLFAAYSVDPNWPPSAQLRDFGFLPAAGAVPDGSGPSATALTVTRSAASLTLSWGDDCPSPGDDYAVYEGTLTEPFTYAHTEKLCTTGGATSATFPEPSGDAYYLIVKRNVVSEGSYGRASSGAERPQGIAMCLPQSIGPTCP